MPSPSSRARRTKHKPRWPGRILQKRGQSSHPIRPSSSFVQYSTLTQSPSMCPPAAFARPLLNPLMSVAAAPIAMRRPGAPAPACLHFSAEPRAVAARGERGRRGHRPRLQGGERGRLQGGRHAERSSSRAGRGPVLSSGGARPSRADRADGEGRPTRRRRDAEGGGRAARRHRLFRLGRGDRLRALGAAGRSAATHRHRRPGAPGRLSRARDPPRQGLEHAPRRGAGLLRSPRPVGGSKGCGRRPAALRRGAFARDASRDAAIHAGGPVRNPADPRRRRRSWASRRSAAPRLGRAGDRHRGVVRSVALPRPRPAPRRSTRTPAAESSPSTPILSRAGGPAAIFRSWGRLRLPQNGT